MFRADAGVSLVTAQSLCQARYGLRSRGGQTRLALSTLRRVCYCLLVSRNHRPLPMRSFRDFNLHGRLYPLPLRLACFLAYASNSPLLDCLQG